MYSTATMCVSWHMARQGVGRLTPCWGREGGWPRVNSRGWSLKPHKSCSGKCHNSVIYVKIGHYWGFHSMLQSHERERKEWRHQLCCVCYCSRDLQWADTRPPCHRNCKDLLCDDIEMKLLNLYDGNELELGLYLISVTSASLYWPWCINKSA